MVENPTLSATEQAEIAEAVKLTDRIRDLVGHATLKDVAGRFGMSIATVSRWLDRRARYDEGDARALLKGKSTGRSRAAKNLSEDGVNRLRRTVLKCGSVALAVQHFVDDPLCPDDLREKFLSMSNPHAIPLSVRRACNVTPEMEAQYRGPVAYQHLAFKCRHSGEVIDPATDEKRALMAGDIYISDDMSRNRYFWFELSDPEATTRTNRGDKLARKHGVAIGRQGLFTMDAAGKWLGVTLIGCGRDAYTSADVLRHMRQTLAEFGKPRIGWVLEKGCWAARTVEGRKVWVPEEERAKTVGGIQGLGFAVEWVHTSEGKALIETGFNHLQKIQSLFDGAPDIGRRRGEMERETKLMSRIQEGVMHPAEAGIEHINEALQHDLKALVFFNSQRKFGRIQHGVPDERWVQDTGRHSLRKLEAKDAGVFMPVKLETEIRQGCVEKRIGGQSFRFSLPELFGELGSGYRVMLCFDDTNPAAGAEIYNLETGARNVRAWPHMEYIGHAEWEAARPLFGYSDQVSESIERRKRFNRGFKMAYAGTGIFGKLNVVGVEQRDGHGNVVEEQIDMRRASTIQDVSSGRSAHPPAARNSGGIPPAGVIPGRGADRALLFKGDKPARKRIRNRLELVNA